MSLLLAFLLLPFSHPTDRFGVQGPDGPNDWHAPCVVTEGNPRDASNTAPVVCADGTAWGLTR